MAVRGIYTEAQQKMLDNANSRAEELEGWAKLPDDIVATKESMKNYAFTFDYWNPLWRDDNYARGTKWGGIIGAPMYQGMFWEGERFALTPDMMPEADFEIKLSGFMEDEWEFFKPIRPGDSFRIWRKRPFLEDITSLDGKGPLTFKVMLNECYYLNQKDELVSRLRRTNRFSLYDEPKKKVLLAIEPMRLPRYIYKKEEMDYIYRVIEEEEIRGANIRWWEDVNIDDETKPVVLGPTNACDTVNHLIGNATKFIPAREYIKESSGQGDWDNNPETGVFHHPFEAHFSDHAAGLQGRTAAVLMMPLARDLAARLATNWMGDDGFLTRHKARYITETLVGDTLIGRGKVVNKRVIDNEDGNEHLVDLKIWIEDMRGYLMSIAASTVSLRSKDSY